MSYSNISFRGLVRGAAVRSSSTRTASDGSRTWDRVYLPRCQLYLLHPEPPKPPSPPPPSQRVHFRPRPIVMQTCFPPVKLSASVHLSLSHLHVRLSALHRLFASTTEGAEGKGRGCEAVRQTFLLKYIFLVEKTEVGKKLATILRVIW